MVDEGTSARVDAVEPPARNKSRSIRIFLRDIFLIFLAALMISFLIKTFLVRSFYIPSESMEQTLLRNDRIIVNQLEPKLIPVSHGDIVVFRDPGGWLTGESAPEQNPIVAALDAFLAFVGLAAPDSNDHLIKRVIGLPGDVIECCDDFGRLSINGVPIEEPYITLPDGVTKVTRDDFEVTVPDDALWVMGDNRYNSADSAFHRNEPTGGFVPLENVVGRAVVVTWPVNRWEWLDNYPGVYAGVAVETTSKD